LRAISCAIRIVKGIRTLYRETKAVLRQDAPSPPPLKKEKKLNQIKVKK